MTTANRPSRTQIEIHASAVIDEPVVIGDGTKIWHFCHVMAGAQLGNDCVLGQNVFVASSVVVGNGCRIQNNVSLYDGVTLEDQVFVGPSCVFTNVRRPRASINQHNKYVRTLVKHGTTLGANATILAGVIIGDWAFIGAGSVVTTNVPRHAVVVGNPARLIEWVDRAGNRLCFSNGVARDPITNEQYRIRNGQLDCPCCVDLTASECGRKAVTQ